AVASALVLSSSPTVRPRRLTGRGASVAFSDLSSEPVGSSRSSCPVMGAVPPSPDSRAVREAREAGPPPGVLHRVEGEISDPSRRVCHHAGDAEPTGGPFPYLEGPARVMVRQAATGRLRG